MSERITLAKVVPAGFRAVRALQEYVSSAVDASTLNLVKLRASIVNGCAYCVDLHTREAIDLGEPTRRMLAVSAWRESPFFDDREKAALGLTDALTRLDRDGVPDDVWEAAVAHFGEEGAANLVLAIGTINVWNRMLIASLTPPPPM